MTILNKFLLWVTILSVFFGAANVRADESLHDGILNTTLGGEGWVVPQILDHHYVSDVALLPDGKILVTGWREYNRVTDGSPWATESTYSSEIFVVRLLPEGNLDLTFGNAVDGQTQRTGFLTFNIPFHQDEGNIQHKVESLVVDQDGSGSFYIAGTSYIEAEEKTYVYVAKFLSDGSIDTSFGSDRDQDGAKEGVFLDERLLGGSVTKLVQRPSGDLFGIGSIKFQEHHFYMAFKISSDGVPDDNFGNMNGLVAFAKIVDRDVHGFNFQVADHVANDVLFLQDGAFMLAGRSSYESGQDKQTHPTVVKFTSAGVPDDNFGEEGFAIYNKNFIDRAEGYNFDSIEIRSLVSVPDNGIRAVAWGKWNNQYDFILLRVRPLGAIPKIKENYNAVLEVYNLTEFDSFDHVELRLESGTSYLYVFGHQQNRFSLSKFNLRTHVLESSFGENGFVTKTFKTDGYAGLWATLRSGVLSSDGTQALMIGDFSELKRVAYDDELVKFGFAVMQVWAHFVDEDGDGHYANFDDCNDQDPNIFEPVRFYSDSDGDGFGNSRNVAQEICDVPGNVNAANYPGLVSDHSDCDDSNANIKPGATDICDFKDNNCDGQIDENLLQRSYYPDEDRDGFRANSGDQMLCGPKDGFVLYTAPIDCDDHNPEKQDRTPLYTDQDHDGYGYGASVGVSCDFSAEERAQLSSNNRDCNDQNGGVNPDQKEICDNGIDDDCNGRTDASDIVNQFYWDKDGDGYVRLSDGQRNSYYSCAAPEGWIPVGQELGDDCNDDDATIKPGSVEICDHIDNNCDGQVDNRTTVVYRDADGDGIGSSETIAYDFCEAGEGYSNESGDCNDNDASITGPKKYYADEDRDLFGNERSFIETCDPVLAAAQNYVLDHTDVDDQNPIVKGPGAIWYADADGDGFPNQTVTTTASTAPSGYMDKRSDGAWDCNDSNSSFNPTAVEDCRDGEDNNCNGEVDEGTRQNFYSDRDHDGFGDTNTVIVACSKPENYVLVSGDCNDHDPNSYPDASEICDGIDNNCDGIIDDGALKFRDSDGDGFGLESESIQTCKPTEGYVDKKGDCDDRNKEINPSALEVCDAVDNNCNGNVDEGLLKTFVIDQDGDGHGDMKAAQWINSFESAPKDMLVRACSAPQGYSASYDDCDDQNRNRHGEHAEICDDLDNDCDGQVNEGLNQIVYVDGDSDGFGSEESAVVVCELSSGFVTKSGDCDDGNLAANPDHQEICDGIDNNCNGSIDELPECQSKSDEDSSESDSLNENGDGENDQKPFDDPRIEDDDLMPNGGDENVGDIDSQQAEASSSDDENQTESSNGVQSSGSSGGGCSLYSRSEQNQAQGGVAGFICVSVLLMAFLRLKSSKQII